ncbi:MAG: endopeptidase La [Planctomycetota bacterium]|nr:endopeptidase La [Planctomycetota bacterium]
MTKRRPVSGKQPSPAVKPPSGELPDLEISQMDLEKKVRSGRGAVGRKDRVMPLLPLRGEVVYPNTIVPIVINRSAGIALVDSVTPMSDRTIVLATQIQVDSDIPSREDLADTACVGQILQMLKFPDGTTRIVFQGMERVNLGKIHRQEPYPTISVKVLNERKVKGLELEALVLHARKLLSRMVKQTQQVPEELQVAAMNTMEPARLADLFASSLPFTVEEKLTMLSEMDVKERFQLLIRYWTRHLEVIELAGRIQAQVGSEITKAQREHFIRQQIKAMQEELGESNDESSESAQISAKLDAAKPPEGVLVEAKRELDRLSGMHPSSAEYSIVRTYLDWISNLPWSVSTKDRLDLKTARKVLDKDHFGLEKIKERIIEYLAVRKLKNDLKGPILCLVGPPGTGKTSLGRSIADALGRKFVRISLGGVHDEAEIRGHRRTYIAALPGRVIQSLRKAGSNNPVFVLDEVDKLGSDFRGDPASALLEVLDPEQNSTFHDHYLDLEFDLSKVLFLATANNADAIPHALLDRMEILELPGYSEEQKLAIAKKHLVPKQLEAHGLTTENVEIPDQTLKVVISEFTREAGLRHLEREIGTVCRKIARKHAEGTRRKATVGIKDLPVYLGPPKFYRETAMLKPIPGVSTGLAWTPTGGEILFIESTLLPGGKGGMTLTGLLGESMRESVQAAAGYIRSKADKLGVNTKMLTESDLHVHVPAGAVPKDGPSAGVAIVASLVSLLNERPVRGDVAMTGEVTLTGRVLPVGGIREKVLAARRAGIHEVLMPLHNQKDLIDLPKEVKADMKFQFVETIDDVIANLFPVDKPVKPKRAAANTKLPKRAGPDRNQGAR